MRISSQEQDLWSGNYRWKTLHESTLSLASELKNDASRGLTLKKLKLSHQLASVLQSWLTLAVRNDVFRLETLPGAENESLQVGFTVSWLRGSASILQELQNLENYGNLELAASVLVEVSELLPARVSPHLIELEELFRNHHEVPRTALFKVLLGEAELLSACDLLDQNVCRQNFSKRHATLEEWINNFDHSDDAYLRESITKLHKTLERLRGDVLVEEILLGEANASI